MGQHSLTFSLCWHWAVQESCQENWSLCYRATDLERAAAEERHERSLCYPDVFLVASIAFGVVVVSRFSIVFTYSSENARGNISGVIFLPAEVSCEYK